MDDQKGVSRSVLVWWSRFASRAPKVMSEERRERADAQFYYFKRKEKEGGGELSLEAISTDTGDKLRQSEKKKRRISPYHLITITSSLINEFVFFFKARFELLTK